MPRTRKLLHSSECQTFWNFILNMNGIEGIRESKASLYLGLSEIRLLEARKKLEALKLIEYKNNKWVITSNPWPKATFESLGSTNKPLGLDTKKGGKKTTVRDYIHSLTFNHVTIWDVVLMIEETYGLTYSYDCVARNLAISSNVVKNGRNKNTQVVYSNEGTGILEGARKWA